MNLIFVFRDAYPEGAREFSFGECVWFCLTSLTPQGGGECPKVSKSKNRKKVGKEKWRIISLIQSSYYSLILMQSKEGGGGVKMGWPLFLKPLKYPVVYKGVKILLL